MHAMRRVSTVLACTLSFLQGCASHDAPRAPQSAPASPTVKTGMSSPPSLAPIEPPKLADLNSEETRLWYQRWNQNALDTLRRDVGWSDTLRQLQDVRRNSVDLKSVTVAGGSIFYLSRTLDEPNFSIYTLAYPATGQPQKVAFSEVGITSAVPAPDGKLVAVTVARGTNEAASLYIIDL